MAAVTGALILVNTVSRIQGDLQLSESTDCWMMATYGLGAALASLVVGTVGKRWPHTRFFLLGALETSVAVLPGNVAPLLAILAFWLLAGIGQNWVNLPAETLLAEWTDEAAQGRDYGAHFAWSHLWYAFAYPLAKFLGTRLPHHDLLIGGGLALCLLAILTLPLRPRAGNQPAPQVGLSSKAS